MVNIIIIGAGFGGLLCAKTLLKQKIDGLQITIITPYKNFVFVPLIHEIAAGYLKEEDVKCNIIEMFKNRKNVGLVFNSATSIDLEKKVVKCRGTDVNFDYLVVSNGSETNFFSVPGAEKNSFQLKSVKDAIKIKSRVESLLRWDKVISVIGGGATGVEIAGELACFLKSKNSKLKLQIIHSGDRILPMLDNKLSKKAQKRLEKLGVKVVLNSKVTKIEKEFIEVNEKNKIISDMSIWTTGIKPATLPIVPKPQEEKGGILVDSKLCAGGAENVYVIGDAAICYDKNKKPVPFLAQAAMEEEKFAAKNIANRISGRPKQNFRFKSKGVLISVGRGYAVGTPLNFKMSGLLPWLMKK
ncbi:MAG TPA: NAD(P)/FAD-dependent oxidoreductase, partial [Candidatus Nanoarchaeia archaeon]|nr:NAD(P)/FAD-dependent oxidoreductase [Candidatus Nanoarchaeia archaeon]